MGEGGQKSLRELALATTTASYVGVVRKGSLCTDIFAKDSMILLGIDGSK